MTTARVAGTVVSETRSDGLQGPRYLLVEDCDRDGAGRNEYLVVLDLVGADRGQVVLIAQGSSCRWVKEAVDRPIDALAVAIVETIDVGGIITYRA